MWGSFARRRQRLAARAPEGPLRHYLTQHLPLHSTPLADVQLLAVDLETSGLDPRHDVVLSIGFVPVDGDRIYLGGAGGAVVNQQVDPSSSARFHGLTHDDLAAGVDLRTALDQLFAALAGRVLLAHHAALETGFLNRACQQVYGASAQFTVVDTMSLQARLLSGGFDDEPPSGSLRLWRARGQFGLPRYTAHEAVTDALACAELYLAQTAQLQSSRSRTLSDVLER